MEVWIKFLLAGLIISGFVIGLFGCGAIGFTESRVRDLPDEVNVKLSIGDTREKVRSILGEPLIDARSIGLEVYRRTGSDLDYYWIIYLPIFLPGEKVTVVVLVVYDHEDVVKIITSELLPPYKYHCVNAGEYCVLRSDWGGELDTIPGPPIDWRMIEDTKPQDGSCSLVLIMGDCPVDKAFLDNQMIADLERAAKYCPAKNKPWSEIQHPSCNKKDRHFFTGHLSEET